ncbi:kinase-like protein [Prochlorococcus marinus str. MIT 9312]|uniref:Kinase-like protein n=1 Tax=Prochlorococcus marinus (strain MIT 9312) TaxID=74546 RepID=Q31AE2_PROM9|nr:AarF/ABC1/UbiB kinase family protein [Prochlorococcus marinus]ABB50153.1 kinase-like protein [Prochlorococcus marinus str. MIT 9312]KGG02005.1 Ubiquinone biosynthesis monooxygenase UbiB [Prochlorococcus marinus str. MIT 9311]
MTRSYSKYSAKGDLVWLMLRPWILIPRVLYIVLTFIFLFIRILFQGNSKNKNVQKNLSKYLFDVITDLGPCFIKLGQALSTRPDLVRQDWLTELANLQDNLPAFDHKIALKIIEEELGAPANELFDEFPDSPIASASLGQVYKAKIKNNIYLAVKVQRPNLYFLIRRDVVILRFLATFFSPFLPLNIGVGIGEIIDEFGRSLFDEIDYEKEGENALKFADLFKENPNVFIPKFEKQFSSKRVITTSWIDGVKLRDRYLLEENNLIPSSFIKTCVISGLQQLFEYGYFHADPHPGNMFALKGGNADCGHLAYVDFGMMDEITNSDRLTLIKAIVHIINEEYYLLAKDFQKLGFLTKDQDLQKLVSPLREVLGGSLGAEVGNFNLKNVTDKFSKLMYSYPFRVPSRFALIIRAVVSQEGLALRLDPEFKILKIAYPYIAKKLLTDNSEEILEILLEVVFDKKGRIQIEKVESLLNILFKDSENINSDLIPVANAGLKLFVGKQGSEVRKNLLLSLIKDDKLEFTDAKKLLSLIRDTFSPLNIAKSAVQKIISPV